MTTREKKYIGDLEDRPGPRYGLSRRGRDSGTALGWYRGQQLGWYEAYKAIRKKYPEAAQAILDHFGLNKDGSIGG